MEIILGFVVLLGCLFIGIRHGGMGLAVVSGVGLTLYTFVFHYKPGTPPVDVMLTILAVVTCAGFLQSSGGLTVMLKYAEKFLRNNPRHITLLAPITTWLLTILCGTGHVVYTMFPIIYDIAIKQNIRPERPMAVASVASQMGISASPVSVALVSVVGFLLAAGYEFSLLQILAVSIPGTFVGVVCAALYSYRRGKDLEKDEEFQKLIEDPEQFAYVYGDNTSLQDRVLPGAYYKSMIIFFIGIAVIAVLGNFPSLLPAFAAKAGAAPKPISMTIVIQMVMLSISAVILFVCKPKASDVANSQVLRAGLGALISVYGVAWMADTFFAAHMGELKEFLGAVVTTYPWTYGVALFLTSKLVNSQGAAVAIIVPMALNLGLNPIFVLSFLPACYGYFFLPTYPSDLACIGFDRSGTTKIGKYVLNHSFMLPGLIGVFTACCMSSLVASTLF